LISASLLLVALGGLCGLGLLLFASNWLLNAFAGTAYAEAASYLPWYALGMTLLGGATVIITIQQSRGKPAFLMLLVPLTLLEPALLIVFHRSLMQVVQVVDVSMAVILSGLATQFTLQRRAGPADTDGSAPASLQVAPRTAVGRVNR
jgi:hypothetical protein